MITFSVESFEESLPELKPILPVHYEELALDKNNIPLDPDYNFYISKDNIGELLYITARNEGDLIGYFIGFVGPGLHYKSTLTCIMDIFFVHPDYRGSNIGFEMFNYVEKELRRRKVLRWYVGSKCHKDASWLFEKLGFERVEITYSKLLGE